MRTRAIVSFLSALVALLPPTFSFATLHVVQVHDMVFDPSDLTVTIGDSVQWTWVSFTHTVTNGTDLSDPNLGTLFDAPLSSSRTKFIHVFNSVGDVPYLCRFHFSMGMSGTVHVLAPTGIGSVPTASSLELEQNEPNPFNPATWIAFTVPAELGQAAGELTVYDLQGRLVRSLATGTFGSGRHVAVWDGRDAAGVQAASGVYLFRLRVGSMALARQMTLLK